MKILSREIQEFIEQIKTLSEIGCITVPREDRERLLFLLNKAGQLIGSDVQTGRVTYYCAEPDGERPNYVKPAILIVTEEDYSEHQEWAEYVRGQAAYFLNVK
jgi:hypothetical protein